MPAHVYVLLSGDTVLEVFEDDTQAYAAEKELNAYSNAPGLPKRPVRVTMARYSRKFRLKK